MSVIIQKLDPGSEIHRNAMGEIIVWSVGAPMIALTTESITAHPLPVAALDEAGDAAGYAAISNVYDHNVGELGGLIVKPGQYNGDLSGKLVQFVVAKAAEELDLETIIAFAHKKSWKLFEKLGGTVIGQRGDATKVEWAAYAASNPTSIDFVPKSEQERDAVIDLSSLLRK